MFNKNELKKPVLIAELCQNHCGSITLLKEMISAACEVGIKYLKIQDINSKNLVHRKKFDKKIIRIYLGLSKMNTEGLKN